MLEDDLGWLSVPSLLFSFLPKLELYKNELGQGKGGVCGVDVDIFLIFLKGSE